MTDIILFWQKHNQKPTFSDADWNDYFNRVNEAAKQKREKIFRLAQIGTYRMMKRFAGKG